MFTDRDMLEICKIAGALIRGRSSGLCATLAVLPVNDDSEGAEGFDIVIDPARKAVRGELLWIDDRLSDGDADRLKFRDLFARCLVPFAESFGQLRFVWDEATNSIVVLPAEPNANSHLSHVDVSFAIA